jgi:hypothetical protein
MTQTVAGAEPAGARWLKEGCESNVGLAMRQLAIA